MGSGSDDSGVLLTCPSLLSIVGSPGSRFLFIPFIEVVEDPVLGGVAIGAVVVESLFEAAAAID